MDRDGRDLPLQSVDLSQHPAPSCRTVRPLLILAHSAASLPGFCCDGKERMMYREADRERGNGAVGIANLRRRKWPNAKKATSHHVRRARKGHLRLTTHHPTDTPKTVVQTGTPE